MSQLPRTALLLAVVLGLALSALAPLAQVLTGGGITAMDLLSDPVELTGTPWYLGGVAALNLFLWAAAAALLLVGAVGLWHRERRFATALGALGGLTGLILLDDRFLLHELVLPHFGVPEIVTYTLYGFMGLAVAVAFGRELVSRPESWLLVLAGVAMAASVGLDLTGIDSTLRRVAEESAKLLGASALTLFPATVLVRRLRDPGAFEVRSKPGRAGTGRGTAY